ncbi:epoxide hydrolase [Saccharopolyspora sp. K220]|uniref:epoxide hydrolase family protein n=1 Tax=Saccharopolyspora soli TaxID=2926618 RepID=UPI001F59BE44|nr:epoxide hydrolase family protein [Saccharopolyspora soli]MCI2422940.1 epoxide hydrolase [Saccharopolyspora soli]
MSGKPFPLQPNPIHVPDEVLDDLRARLKATRFPVDAGNDDWHYGVGRRYLAELVDYWLESYDWRKAETKINEYEQYDVVIDGVPIHFMRKPGVGPNPTPLICSGGWPWTDQMWTKVMGPLADPGAYGGDPAEAFDVIVATLPGWGFSSPLPDHPDMNFWKIADLWHKLMTEVLGYEKYAAAGSDMGSLVTAQLGHKYADELYAIHVGSPIPLNMFNGDRAWDLTGGAQIPDGTPENIRQEIKSFHKRFAAHVAVHTLDSSTLAYGLSDSPAGMLAWILERWANWSDNDGNVENVFSKDEILTNAMIYWVTNSIGTSMRAYANAVRYPWTPSHDLQPPVQAITGITLVGYENPPGVTTENRVADFLKSPREPWYNHVNVTAHPRGGHFIPWEVPDEWVDDLRRTFRGGSTT